MLHFSDWHINQVLKAMRESDSTKPAVFAMSNPTMNGLSLQNLSIIPILFMLVTISSLKLVFAC